MSATISKRPRSWWYPYIFVAMFMVVIAVNAALFYFATSTFTGLSSAHAYLTGIRYNNTLDQAEAQKKLGWKVETRAVQSETDPHGYELEADFVDADGKPLDNLTAAAYMDRPVQSGYLRKVQMEARGNGHYTAHFISPLPGQWDFEVVARKDGDLVYQVAQKVILK
jgi:nitrogen fixation protein FixH